MIHDAYPKGYAGRWWSNCDTCNARAGPYQTRADATLASASHIQARRETGDRLTARKLEARA